MAKEKKLKKQEEEAKLAVDFFEDDENFYLLAPIAGVDVDNVSVTVSDDVLTVKGERHFERDLNEVNFISQECYFGEFSRSMILPEDANAKQVQATFKNNVLTVKIAKIPHKEKKIKIQIDD
jgi:HSP20 family protein